MYHDASARLSVRPSVTSGPVIKSRRKFMFDITIPGTKHSRYHSFEIKGQKSKSSYITNC